MAPGHAFKACFEGEMVRSDAWALCGGSRYACSGDWLACSHGWYACRDGRTACGDDWLVRTDCRYACSDDRLACSDDRYTRIDVRYTPGNDSTARRNQRRARLGKAVGRLGYSSSRRALCDRPRELVNTSNGVCAGSDWFSDARDTRASTAS